MVERDDAQMQANATGCEDDLRHYINLRNQVNQRLHQDNKNYNWNQYNKDRGNPVNQYKTAREQMGWTNIQPPSRIISKDKLYLKPSQIAEVMNAEYIERNNNLSKSIPQTGIDPLDHFGKVIETPKNKLILQTPTMHELRKILREMKPTPSSGYDNISIKTIKNYQTVLEPLLLNLVTRTIETSKFPSN